VSCGYPTCPCCGGEDVQALKRDRAELVRMVIEESTVKRDVYDIEMLLNRRLHAKKAKP